MSTLRVDNIQDQGGAERRGLKTYAIICDEKAHDANGGTFTQDAWQTRDLNTEISDPDGIVSIASNQFTLQTGSYLIEWTAPGYKVDRHFTRLQNITDSTTEELGSVMYTRKADNIMNRSVGFARVTITASKTFEIQHRCELTEASFGFGVNTNVSGVNSRYTMVKILKEA